MYTKEISFRDLQIVFNYKYTNYPGHLGLVSWTAYCGRNEVDIPCRLEADFIEDKLIDWLDEEYAKNSINYHEEYLASLAEKKYNMVKDK